MLNPKPLLCILRAAGPYLTCVLDIDERRIIGVSICLN